MINFMEVKTLTGVHIYIYIYSQDYKTAKTGHVYDRVQKYSYK